MHKHASSTARACFRCSASAVCQRRCLGQRPPDGDIFAGPHRQHLRCRCGTYVLEAAGGRTPQRPAGSLPRVYDSDGCRPRHARAVDPGLGRGGEERVGLGARRVALIGSFCFQRDVSAGPETASCWTAAIAHVLHVVTTHALGVAVLGRAHPAWVRQGRPRVQELPSRGPSRPCARHAPLRALPVPAARGICRVRALSSAGVWGSGCRPSFAGVDGDGLLAWRPRMSQHCLRTWRRFAHPTRVYFG